MCGIVGGVSKSIKEGEALLMISAIKHRGPDGDGAFFDRENNLFLGHRRLSIIDLSDKANQPMQITTKDHKDLVITFNGEIYNYKEVRRELEVKGYKFLSSSDTEVVLNSYAQWGIKCLDKFRGMFAFVIWDLSSQELTVVRDRFGVKPLHYYLNGDDFVFASELKAIYQFPNIKKEIDSRALGNYFQFGYISAPQTIFKGISKLEAGHYLKLKINQGRIVDFSKKQYWNAADVFFDTSGQVNLSGYGEVDLLVELEKILLESFQYRMVADVDVGLFLSGGIDSSLIGALLQKNSSQKIKTFTIGFEDKRFDEAVYARKVAKLIGSEHHEFYLSAKDLEDSLDKYVEIFDEPFGDSSALPTYLLSQKTKEYVKVALSGDGGDELFFGYSKYLAVLKILKNPRILNIGIGKLIKIIGPEMSGKIYSLIPGLSKQPNLTGKLYKLSNLLSGKNLSESFGLASSYWQEKEIEGLFMESGMWNVGENYLRNEKFDIREQMQLWDIQNYLCDDILVKSDRSTMANGLEAREPYLDDKILRFFASTPDNIKYKEPKYLLKQILYKHLPKELFNRSKTGFQPPIYQILNKNWKNYYREFLNSDIIKKQEIFNVEQIDNLALSYQKGKYVNPEKLWLLVAFQMWYERWYKH